MFLNYTKQTCGLCLWPNQTHGQNPYMSRLSERVYDQIKSADLSETWADPHGLCRRLGCRPESLTKPSLACVVQFMILLIVMCSEAWRHPNRRCSLALFTWTWMWSQPSVVIAVSMWLFIPYRRFRGILMMMKILRYHIYLPRLLTNSCSVQNLKYFCQHSNTIYLIEVIDTWELRLASKNTWCTVWFGVQSVYPVCLQEKKKHGNMLCHCCSCMLLLTQIWSLHANTEVDDMKQCYLSLTRAQVAIFGLRLVCSDLKLELSDLKLDGWWLNDLQFVSV